MHSASNALLPGLTRLVYFRHAVSAPEFIPLQYALWLCPLSARLMHSVPVSYQLEMLARQDKEEKLAEKRTI